MFVPPLPEDKVQAISKLAIGVVDKLFITFRSKEHKFREGQQAQPSTARHVLSYQLLWKVPNFSLSDIGYACRSCNNGRIAAHLSVTCACSAHVKADVYFLLADRSSRA